MNVSWDIAGYKARLGAAIRGKRWAEADRIRVATKRRLLEAVAHDRPDEVEEARNAISDSIDELRFSENIKFHNSPETTLVMLIADGETAGLAVEVRPRFEEPARNVEDAVLRLLSSDNRRPMSTTDLAKQTGYRPETVARTLTKLRSKGQVVSRRSGRHMLHIAIDPDSKNSLKIREQLENKLPVIRAESLQVSATSSPGPKSTDILMIDSSLGKERVNAKIREYYNAANGPALVELVGNAYRAKTDDSGAGDLLTDKKTNR